MEQGQIRSRKNGEKPKIIERPKAASPLEPFESLGVSHQLTHGVEVVSNKRAAGLGAEEAAVGLLHARAELGKRERA